MKSIDTNDAADTIVRQASGKDSILTFSRTGDNPTQWFQLLNALDQPDLPGWPLLIPQKVQMQKCEKCSREFCAPINYRRHVRIHRRSLNVDKDSHKIRDVLAAFWDKLSLEKAKEVVSFNDVTLKEVSGYTLIKAWASSIHKPGAWTLPHEYVTSGSTLLEVINAKPSRLPISSQELFYILDDASEKTFLCAGTAESVQTYLFDGEVMKVALELRNMVACISFLFERNLVKAWLADKDAKALRCQKLLMEEEEAARKRQAELLERKKQRKLRQKEQKEKEQLDITVSVNSMEHHSLVVETSTQSTPSGSNSDTPDMLSIDEPIHSLKTEEYINGSGAQMVDSTPAEESSYVRRRWRVPKSQRNRRNGFLQESQQQLNLQMVHVVEPSQKVWTKKFRIENDENNNNNKHRNNVSEDGAVTVSRHEPDENNCELIIGSISVSLPVIHKKDVGLRNKLKKNDDIKQIPSSDNVQSTGIRRQWRPLSNGNEARAQSPVTQSVERDSENVEVEKLVDADGNQSKDDSSKERKGKDFLSSLGDVTALSTGGVVDFSSVDARAFLAERWKNAVSADHVKLVISHV